MPSDQLTLAISTCWNAHRHGAPGPLLDEIRQFGIRRVELASITATQLVGLEEALAQRDMVVQSIHNPCPWPLDGLGQRVHWAVPDMLASPSEDVRLQCVAQAQATIDHARRLGARAVVVHLGHIDTTLPQPELYPLLRGGRRDEFLAHRERALAERRALAPPYLRSALASIRELGECALRAGVALGVETRPYYDHVPSLAEFDAVFEAAAGLPVYYWHDVGHAATLGLLGLAAPEEFLQRYGGRLLGVHLHDAIRERDHLPPGQGEIDFAALADALPPGALRTVEIGESAAPAAIRAGISLLAGLGLA